MSDVTRFLWVRHFPVAAKGIYIGQLDLDAVIPPSLPTIILPDAAVWMTSPLKRARQTMEWLRPKGEIIPAPELMEQNFGAWEGKHYADIQMDCTQAETIQPPQGETFLDVTKRVHAWIERMLEQRTGQTLIAVCHAGPIRAALSHALAVPAAAALRFTVDYNSLSETVYLRHGEGNFGRVERLNIATKT